MRLSQDVPVANDLEFDLKCKNLPVFVHHCAAVERLLGEGTSGAWAVLVGCPTGRAAHRWSALSGLFFAEACLIMRDEMPVFSDQLKQIRWFLFLHQWHSKKKPRGLARWPIKFVKLSSICQNRLLLIEINLVRPDLVEVFFCAFIFCLVGFLHHVTKCGTRCCKSGLSFMECSRGLIIQGMVVRRMVIVRTT